MKKFIKYSFLIFIVFILTIIALSQIKHKDTSAVIKPIAQKIAQNYQFLKNKENKMLSKQEVIDLLKISDCKELNNINSSVVKPNVKGVVSYYNHWFSALCLTNSNKLLKIQMTFNEKNLPYFTIINNHSYCFKSSNYPIKCYTQSLITLPSR